MTLGDLVSATDINVCKKKSNFLSGKGGWCEAAGNRFKGAGASEAPGQTKEEFSINDTSKDPKVLKIGPQHG